MFSLPAAARMSNVSKISNELHGGSALRCSVDLRSTNNGVYVEQSYECNNPVSEERTSVSKFSLPENEDSADIKGNNDYSIHRQGEKAGSLGSPRAMPDPPHPVTDSKSLCNGHLLKIDAHVTGSRPLVISTGDNAPTGSISLASNVLQELTSIEKTQVKYECMTQTDGCYELCIGEGCQIPRWRIGSVILYNICTETFATSVAADSVSAAMTEAISMWGEIKGVVFKEVGRDDPATFRIKYKKSHSSHPNVYAKSFLPRECPSSLVVYQKALENTSYLANILAHELGHIWGLRHEFAPEKEKYLPSVRIGSENRQSIMNYFDDLSKLQVGEQDRKELAAFYAHGQAKYEGLLIVNITAPLHTW